MGTWGDDMGFPHPLSTAPLSRFLTGGQVKCVWEGECGCPTPLRLWPALWLAVKLGVCVWEGVGGGGEGVSGLWLAVKRSVWGWGTGFARLLSPIPIGFCPTHDHSSLAVLTGPPLPPVPIQAQIKANRCCRRSFYLVELRRAEEICRAAVLRDVPVPTSI